MATAPVLIAGHFSPRNGEEGKETASLSGSKSVDRSIGGVIDLNLIELTI